MPSLSVTTSMISTYACSSDGNGCTFNRCRRREKWFTVNHPLRLGIQSDGGTTGFDMAGDA